MAASWTRAEAERKLPCMRPSRIETCEEASVAWFQEAKAIKTDDSDVTEAVREQLQHAAKTIVTTKKQHCIHVVVTYDLIYTPSILSHVEPMQAPYAVAAFRDQADAWKCAALIAKLRAEAWYASAMLSLTSLYRGRAGAGMEDRKARWKADKRKLKARTKQLASLDHHSDRREIPQTSVLTIHCVERIRGERAVLLFETCSVADDIAWPVMAGNWKTKDEARAVAMRRVAILLGRVEDSPDENLKTLLSYEDPAGFAASKHFRFCAKSCQVSKDWYATAHTFVS